MQVLDTAQNKVDNDQTKKIESIGKKGQRLFQLISEKHTNSATVENESPAREGDSNHQPGAKSDEERLRQRDSHIAQQLNPGNSDQKDVES